MTPSQNNFAPSEFQQAIFNWIKNPEPANRVAVIQAVAGSGKSTTLKEGCKFIDPKESVLFVAFASRNIADLKNGLPLNAEAATLNSIGFRAWRRFVGVPKMEITKDINYRLIYEFVSQETGSLNSDIQSRLAARYRDLYGAGPQLERYTRLLGGNFTEEVGDINRLIALAKGSGLVPNVLVKKGKFDYCVLLQDTHDNWTSLIEDYDLALNFPDVAIEIARHVLVRSIELASEEIDFDSQLWLPIIHRARFDQYDWVLVDELQDLNSIQVSIVCACMKESSRAIGVGDRNQAIYYWRGSLSNTMDFFKDRFKAIEFPLSICYRCAQDVVKHAAEIVPHIQAHDKQIKGVVQYAADYGPGIFNKEDIVICRNSSPLISLAYCLFKSKVSCKILGRDIETGMVKMIKRCSGKSKEISSLEANMKVMYDREFEICKKKHNYAKSDSIKDRIDAVNVFIGELPENNRTVTKLIENINRIFKMDALNKAQMLCLSTGHKSKGGEWNNVFILEPGLMPSKRAKSEEALRQEYNLMYVMRTRAKKTLTYINLNDFNDKSTKPEIKPYEVRCEVGVEG